MTWVKVCGLLTEADVATAVAAGADAVGFVSHPGSPRYLSLDAVAGLARGLPVTTVLLTVDLGVRAALTAVEATGVTGIQPYGPDAGEVVRAAVAAGLFVLDPVPAGTAQLPERGAMPLLDTPDDAVYGGTGRSFDWRLASDLERDFVLAGGLGPENVAQAIAQVDPWGVDASSGLEVAAGVKDPGKVADFVRKAKQT